MKLKLIISILLIAGCSKMEYNDTITVNIIDSQIDYTFIIEQNEKVTIHHITSQFATIPYTGKSNVQIINNNQTEGQIKLFKNSDYVTNVYPYRYIMFAFSVDEWGRIIIKNY